jgi:hypothetical protein
LFRVIVDESGAIHSRAPHDAAPEATVQQMLPALMLIVICAHPQRAITGFAHEISKGLRILLLFTISRLDSAGEFRTRGSKNNGGRTYRANEAGFGPAIDARARAAAVAGRDLGGTSSNFMSENRTRPLPAPLANQ